MIVMAKVKSYPIASGDKIYGVKGVEMPFAPVGCKKQFILDTLSPVVLVLNKKQARALRAMLAVWLEEDA